MAPRWGRKVVRFVHLAVNGTWLGAIVAAWLLVAGAEGADAGPVLSAFRLHDSLVVWLAVVVLGTGLFFGLSTPWGLVRSWWLAGKWMGLGLLGLGIPFVVAPAMSALAAHADVAAFTGRPDPALLGLRTRVLLLLGIEALLVLLLFALSAWRPARTTGWRPEGRRWVRIGLPVAALLTVGASVAGSTMLARARSAPLERRSAEGLADGERSGTVDWLGATMRVGLELRSGRITTLEVLERPVGLYPDLAALVAAKVEAAGSLETIDGVSGATTTSRGLLVAASEALGP